MMGYSEPNDARLAAITDVAELSNHFRKLDVEKDIWQVAAAEMVLEDSLLRITDALQRHDLDTNCLEKIRTWSASNDRGQRAR